MKVLLVDDSTTIRMMLKGLLKQLQITDVIEAGNGLDALAALDQHKVDIALLDIHMPQMDGITFLSELHKRPAIAHLPVIVVSSDTAAEQTARAVELGAKASVRKPFRLDALKQALTAALENSADKTVETASIHG
ncbi:MAG TPA: response regulator [Planctomycetota bacterium]